MTEDFLHFIWNYGLFERSGIYACNGEPVEVINTGEHNNNAGPDFLNARIRIGNTIWAGNVEIHVPDGLAVKLVATSGIGEVLVDPALVKTGEGTYESADYDAKQNRITIEVSNGAGSVNVRMLQ